MVEWREAAPVRGEEGRRRSEMEMTSMLPSASINCDFFPLLKFLYILSFRVLQFKNGDVFWRARPVPAKMIAQSVKNGTTQPIRSKTNQKSQLDLVL